MIEFKEVADGETWELFARDFLMELGFFVESSPDRGPDSGKDMLVTEQLSGALGNYKLKWLVSCKNFAQNAKPNKAVNEDDEPNILERVEGFGADGFIGVYATVASAGLNTRLTQLRERGKIKDFRFFDHKLIENFLMRIGHSHLMMRYFPESYKAIRPIHQFFGQYIPLPCSVCGKDLLESLYESSYQGIVTYWWDPNVEPETIEEITFVCKGVHDIEQQESFKSRGLYSSWDDISDMVIPAGFLKFLFAAMNNLRSGRRIFTDHSFEQLKTLTMALAQKALRENTVNEQQRVENLLKTDWDFGV